MSAHLLSIIMPAHDEAQLLEQTVTDVADAIAGHPFEIVVVENGSRDATPEIAARLARKRSEVRVVTLPTADYGAAMRTGVLTAAGWAVVVFDVDYYDVGFLRAAVDLLRAEPDPPAVVVGSKRAPGARDERPRHRRAVTAVLGRVLQLGFGLGVSDTHGMKAMRREAVEPIVRRCRSARDLFDTELVLRCERAGLGVAEFPVDVVERRPSRTPIARRIPRSVLGLLALRIALWRERD